MPLAAVDGTMRKRLRNTPVAGKAHVKTGTLNTVRAIAGYSRDGDGNVWAVVAILNHPRPWGASSIWIRCWSACTTSAAKAPLSADRYRKSGPA